MLPLLPRPDPDPNSLQLSVFVIFASLSERYLSATSSVPPSLAPAPHG